MEHALLKKAKHIHLIGMSGIGMTGLAQLLHEKGYRISGSDLKRNEYVDSLVSGGVTYMQGHRSENIVETVDLVCYSSAIKPDNAELVAAQARGIPLLKRAELLAMLTEEKTLIAVAGSHGKTTTTALLSFVLKDLGYDPTVFIGGVSLNYGQIAWWGKDIFIVEVDESDGSFLYFKPDYAIVTNIDKEHLDYYKSEDNIKASFGKFISSVKRMTIACGDDPNTNTVASPYPSVLTYGLKKEHKVYADNVRSSLSGSLYDAVLGFKEVRINDVETPLLGTHNVLNSLAVFTLLSELKIDPERVKESFRKFKGTKRRFQIKGVVDGTIFVDDYAHHPSEIKATLSAAKFFNRRVVAIFEPHRYSRFSVLSEEFKKSFDMSDVVVVTDIYSANELRTINVDMEHFCRELGKNINKPVYFVPEGSSQKVVSLIKEGDIVLGLGAGRITEVLDEVIKGYKKAKSVH